MNPNDLAADLPAPRDDEPESLRQDIVDELADHLQCAVQRELLASRGRQSPDHPDVEQTAWQAVLERFGNPASIAHRLWWDAMKEKVMAQRITAIMAGITAVAVVAMAVLLWRGIERQTTAAAAIQESNAAILDRLVTAIESPQQDATSPEAPSAADDELRHLELRLVHDEPGGSPASGYKLSAAGVSRNDDLVRLVTPRTDREGRARLSMNRVGVFYLSIESPQGESGSTLIPMGPEHPDAVELVVPSPRQHVAVESIDIPRPEELGENEYLFEITMGQLPRTTNGIDWYLKDEGFQASLLGQYTKDIALLVSPDGKVLGRIVRSFSESVPVGATPNPEVVFQTVPFDALPAGEYAIQTVRAYRIEADPDPGQRDHLVSRSHVKYDFAPGTMTREAAGDNVSWTIDLPDFAWTREIEDPDGTLQGAGGGFF